MTAKTFELRDRSTYIAVLAVKLTPTNEADRYLLGRSGYGTTPERQSEYILMMGLAGGEDKCTCDPHDWTRNGTRTRFLCHQHIIENWDNLESGAVIDVEFLLGESAAPKESERTAQF